MSAQATRTASVSRPVPGSRPATFSPSDRRLSPRRVVSLARAEIRLLVRNRALLFYSVGLPLAFALLILRVSAGSDTSDAARTTQIVMSVTGFALLFGVFYSLVSTFVARRQDLVLKRLRAGESSALDVLTAISAPAALVVVAQVLVATLLAVVTIGFVAPANVLLAVLAVLGGIVVAVLVAAVSSAFSRTVESVQVTTLPVLIVLCLAPGFLIPTGVLPENLETVAWFLPLGPVVELLTLGIAGTDRAGQALDLAGTFAAAAQPAGVLVLWCAVGLWATIRFFRWEPRR